MVGSTLYVGNLPFETTKEDLERLFSQAGTCKSVTLVVDRMTGRPRGLAFVEMGSKAEAQKAVQDLDGHDLLGRVLRVNEARERQHGWVHAVGSRGPKRRHLRV